MKTQKAIVFDTGTLITFSMNCLLDILRDLKKQFNGKFIITDNVKYEMITRPMNIKKYKLGALRLKALYDEKIVEGPTCFGINQDEINKQTKDFLKLANSVFYKDKNPIHLIDQGEAQCLALSSILSEKGIKNVIAIDERTTRMLCERPENLRKLMEKKLHTKIISKSIDKKLKKFKFIRSSELVFVAYKKGLVKKDAEILDAMLYGVKFKGCAISGDEIKIMEKIM